MKLAERTFRKSDYKITSPFGNRGTINTSKGVTASFHNGTDYGTNGEKWPQYALEDGKVTKVLTDSYGAKCVYIEYPRTGKRLFYAHLDSICVKTGQSVNKDTIIGYTGKTGKATGIHLHLGLQSIGFTTWLNPESYDYNESSTIKIKLPSRGYFKKGDRSESIEKINEWLYSKYKDIKVKGMLFGDNTLKYVKKYQTDAKARGIYTGSGATIDGNIGPLTLNAMRKDGFNY